MLLVLLQILPDRYSTTKAHVFSSCVLSGLAVATISAASSALVVPPIGYFLYALVTCAVHCHGASTSKVMLPSLAYMVTTFFMSSMGAGDIFSSLAVVQAVCVGLVLPYAMILHGKRLSRTYCKVFPFSMLPADNVKDELVMTLG
mmetsp:Transcript_5663/g.10680  ORF Transcript_5663/g.10680 Transcript_5663/m.10680 type:complete len:145 (-) Transcript_5663:275-709(-)